jgi:DNA-binding phage protein
MKKKIDQLVGFSADMETVKNMKAIAKDTGMSQSLIFRRLIAMAVARSEKEQSYGFLIASE